MTTAYPHLLSPGRIGTLELRNRIVMAPMGDHLPNEDGTVSENQAAYFEARARGGAAMLLVGSVSVSYPDGCFAARQVAASDDTFLPGLLELTDRAHRHGARIAAQLTHNGQMSLLDVERGDQMLVPSVPKDAKPDHISMMVTAEEGAAMMSPFTQPTSRQGDYYKVMTEADIAWVTERFVDAVERCQRAGFDGVELHAGHGYLIDEFLTPSMNTREDGWGGSLESRARLLIDILRAVRARVGPDYPLWIRINAVEHHKTNGETFEDQLRVIQMAVDAGIDAVHLTAYGSTDVATTPTDGYAPHTYEKGKAGSLTEYAAQVRRAVAVPVITFGRMEPDEAEAVLAEGKGDFIVMGRKLLADPDLPNKLAEGRIDDVRPCIYQYRCIGNIFIKGQTHCVGNAQTGREHDLAALRTVTAAPKRVLVIGGGPGGLETARVLATRGHAVTLWEAAERLGGMLRFARSVDPLLDQYASWLARQVEKLGVTIEVGRWADAATVAAFGADEVVVATGARWGRPALPGADLPHVRTVPELAGWLHGDDAAVGARVVVIGGGKPGITLSTALREAGREVTLLEPTHVFCTELGLPGRWRLVADAEAAGVVLVGLAAVQAITADAVMASVQGNAPQAFAADTVIIAGGAVPDGGLMAELAGLGIAARAVGDCVEVRRIEGANLDAAAVALALG